MAKVVDVYNKYKVTKHLQRHQLSVAAVAKQICDNLLVSVDKESVVTACLLHDMANVLKFDFSSPDEWFEPEGKEYWKKVQQETADKYGSWDEHQVTVMMAKEIGVSPRVIELIDSVGFGQAIENSQSNDLEAKICDNSDLRVVPNGIVSLQERLEEGRERYKDRLDKWIAPDRHTELEEACFAIEKQVFEHCQIKPEDITDDSTKPIVERLRTYEI